MKRQFSEMNGSRDPRKDKTAYIKTDKPNMSPPKIHLSNIERFNGN